MINSSLQTRDRHIPFYFIAFFVALAIVDGTMVTIAIRTHTGLVTDHPYERGLAYNQVVQAASLQDEQAWKGTIVFKQIAQQKGVLMFRLNDKSGKVLMLDSVYAEFIRPTQQGMDFSVIMEGIDSAVTLPAKGVWDIRIHASHQGIEYQQSKRIVVE